MATNIKKRLLKKGYFPDELGPWFTTEDLEKKVSTIERAVTFDKKKISKCSKLSIPKGQFGRRRLMIQNPYNFMNLCKQLHDNWSTIKVHLDSSDLSLTTPVFINNTERAVSRKYSFEDITGIFLNKSIAANYILRADISRYYSTIYTHSIPWALHTKGVAKANRGDGLIGNLLDKLIRNAQDAQTMGIPIGPDTSLIISEIIGVAIDKEIMSTSRYKEGFRYVDDYFLFFDNLADAEFTLSELQTVIENYELELNKDKTKIYKMPQALEPQWVSRLNSFVLSNNNLLSFINEAYILFEKHPNEEVLKYSITKIQKININKKNWGVLQSFLINSMIYEPDSSPIACHLMSVYYHKKFGVDTSKILKAVDNILDKAQVTNCDYEVIWMLWLTKLLKVDLTNSLIAKLGKIDNPFVALIVLSNSRIRNSSHLDTSLWENHMKVEDLYSEYWPLAYEALKRKWLPSVTGKDYIEENIFFKTLKDSGVNFFNTNARQKWIDKNIDEKWIPNFSPAF